MSLVHNEQTKLTAGWFNTLGSAIVAAGAFAPAAAVIYQLTPAPLEARTMVALAFGCFIVGGILHIAGRAFLRRLRE